FFFSSRRRHTRFSRDWSSDVCSSDLLISTDPIYWGGPSGITFPNNYIPVGLNANYVSVSNIDFAADGGGSVQSMLQTGGVIVVRSEERRVGKGCSFG